MSHQSRSKTRTCFSLLENKLWYMEMPESDGGHFWGSFDDWLIMVKPLTVPSLRKSRIQISLLNPFSGVEVHLPCAINNYHKLVFSGHPCERTCTYLLLSWSNATLALWGHGAQDWCRCEVVEEDDPFADAICFNGFFYLLTDSFNIRVINVKFVPRVLKKGSCNLAKIKTQLIKTELSFDNLSFEVLFLNKVLRNMIELSGEIILVCRFLKIDDHSPETFRIYKLDIDGVAWVKLDSLGDYVLCVSRNCSRSFSSKEFGDGTANCIYFTNERGCLLYNEWDIECFDHESSQVDDWGIFRLDTNRQGSFFYPGKKRTWPLLWITAPLWWYYSRPSERITSSDFK